MRGCKYDMLSFISRKWVQLSAFKSSLWIAPCLFEEDQEDWKNGLAVPGSFLAKTTSQAIVVTKLDDDEIIRLKELCAHMDVIVEKLRQRPLFLYYKP